MPAGNPIQVGFNGGQLGPRMAGRVDLARFRTGCKRLENFIPTVQGPAIKRSGTRFVKEVASSSQTSRLIPFEFSRDQAYVLEFADNKIRFMRDEGAVLEPTVAISAGTPPTIANPCVITTNVAHGYSTGNEIFIVGSRLEFLNDQFFTVTVTGATTFTLSQNGTAISSVGESLVAAGANTVARTYQIADGVSSNSIPWNHDELDELQFAQDQDVMYLAHPLYPPHKLVRTSDTSWTCTAIDFRWPIFRDENITAVTMYASAATGTAITVTASSATFTANMVGGYIKIGELATSLHPKWIPSSNMGAEFNPNIALNDRVEYGGRVYELTATGGKSNTGTIPPVHDEGVQDDRDPGESGFEWTYINRGWGYGKITAVGGGGTTATVDVDTYGVEFPASVVGSGTKKWALGAFSAEYGYPAAVALFESRLWFGGTEKDQQSFWGSRTNRYEDFEIIGVEADSGQAFTVKSNRKNAIQWMAGEEVLLVGTRGGEVAAYSNAPDEAITAANIKVKRRSAFGSAQNVSPVPVDSALLMVHRSGTRIHELLYDINSEKYAGPDLTALSDDIIIDGAKSLSYQAAPFRQVWAHTSTGRLVAMTYVRDEEVMGWAEFPIGGAVGVGDAVIESQCVIPSADGDQDQVWIIAKRTLAGSTRRYIEFLERPFEPDDAIEDAFFCDSGASYSGSAVASLAGLLHLAGQIVSVLADGVAALGTVTSKGKLNLVSCSPPLTTASDIHLGFTYSAQLETMDFDMGGAPMSTSLGDRGRVASAVILLDTTGQGVEYGGSLDGTLDPWTQEDELFTGATPLLTVPAAIDRQCRLAVRHRTALPCTVVALMPKTLSEVG